MPDKLGPIEIEFVLDKQADEQAKKLKASLDAVGTSAKAAIKEQKALIQSLEEDIKRIQNLITSATPMAKNKGIFAELSRMKEDLAIEQGKLNELQHTGIKQDAEEVVSKNKIIASLKSWGLGLLTITGAIKIFKELIASSNVLTEEFGFAVDGAKGALQQFFQVFSAGAGQTGNPIANMIKGFKGSKELAKDIDIYNDSMRANQVLNAREIKDLKELEAVWRQEFGMMTSGSDVSKEAKDALNKWIDIRKEAAARELKIEQDLNTSLLNEIKNRPNLKGITDQEIGGFVTMYAKNPELMKKAAELSKLYSGMASWDTGDKIANLRKEIEALLPKGITFESLMSSIRLNSALSDKQIDALAESYKRLAIAQAGGADVEAEVARYIGIIGKNAKEEAKKINDLRLQIDILKTSLATANESERKGIAEKIILLEKELKLQEAIVNAALMAATVRETSPSKIRGLKAPTLLPGGLKIPNTLAGKPTFDSGDYIQGTAMLTEAGKAKQKKKDAEYDKASEDSLKRQLKLRDEIVKAAADLINQIGQQIGLDEKSMALLNAGLDAFKALATKGAAGIPEAAMAMLLGIIKQIPSEASRFEAQIEHINQLLVEQQRLIDQSEQKGGQEQLRKDALDTLNQKAAAEKAEYERLQRSADKHLDLLGWRQKKADEAYKTWQDTTNLIEDSNQALTDFYTNTTSLAVADAIAQGFQDGKTSAADFADTFNGFMMQAINSALEEMSKPAVAAWYKKLSNDMASGGGLSEAEVADLKNDWDKIVADNKATRDAAYKVAGIDPTGGASSSANSMTGAIKGITEETASVLAGQVNNIRISQALSAGIMRQQLMHLAKIETNTAHLISIDNKLGALGKTNSLRSQGLQV